ncbi:LuxR C-terminal-related transcriptional regulator [Lysinibacillus sp. NPDC093210]|uniref:LuxR C-terminal-related transcriptional regulator n=1 Tax=Lysinibacillus sp. NPDC093210 TaxID=3364133 RepID=UPI0038123C01
MIRCSQKYNAEVYALNYRIKEYEQKFAEVQNRISFVEGDREVEVLHRLLDGDSMRAIGKHMSVSSTTIFRVRNNILNQMMK